MLKLVRFFFRYCFLLGFLIVFYLQSLDGEKSLWITSPAVHKPSPEGTHTISPQKSLAISQPQSNITSSESWKVLFICAQRGRKFKSS